MKQFSDLCKNTVQLQIDTGTSYKIYLTDNEIMRYYAFARYIQTPQHLVTNILNRTKGEVIESVSQIWQLFLKHRAKALRKHQLHNTNPYRTQRDRIRSWPTCGCVIVWRMGCGEMREYCIYLFPCTVQTRSPHKTNLHNNAHITSRQPFALAQCYGCDWDNNVFCVQLR